MTASMPHALLANLASAGATPRLTWYGTDGERVELSGRVLANWVVKATNLLVEEADAEPGVTIGVHIPVHWRAAVWTLAAWTAGAAVTLLEDDPTGEAGHGSAADVASSSRPDVLVTWAPGRVSTPTHADLLLAVALPGLARSWDGGPDASELPAGAIDAAAEILGYGDELGYTVAPRAEDLALGDVRFGGLQAWAEENSVFEPGHRILRAPRSVHDLLRDSVQTWLGGGSIVLLHPEVAGDAERRERIAGEEQVA